MATMPTASNLGQSPVPRANEGVAQYEPPNWKGMGAAGREMSSAGHDLMQAGQIIEATNDRQDQITAEAALNQLHEASLLMEHDPKGGFRSVKEGGTVGPGFVDGYMGRLNERAQKISEGLQNDRQRQAFQQRSQVLGLQYRRSLLEHQAVQTDKFNDSTTDNRLKLLLRSMAQRPDDELSFQTQMVEVNKTVGDYAARKGLPPEEQAALKAKYLDAAYTTRILSVLHGAPGQAAQPYRAEEMYHSVRDGLGPEARSMLDREVLQGVKDVQMRDGAYAEVHGGGGLNAKRLYPAVSGSAPLEGVVKQMESGGRRYDKDGRLLTSPAGALGEMQVMPATAKNPGLGVMPARDDSPDELARVGRDYLGALVARYQDPALAMAAYNAGPGRVDEWIVKYGDPRAGQVSVEAWASKIPFEETRKYVQKGLGLLRESGDAPGAGFKSARQLKAEDVPPMLERARKNAEALYPNDPRFVDGYVARVQNYANMAVAQVKAGEQAASDTLVSALAGTKPDGSDALKSIDEAMANPQIRQAFDAASPQGKREFQNALASGGQHWTPDGQRLYYTLIGKAGSEDKQPFVDEVLSEHIGKMPPSALLHLMEMQKSIRTKDVKEQERDLNTKKAWGVVKGMWDPMIVNSSNKQVPHAKEMTAQFQGRLFERLEQERATTGAWPDDRQTQKLAAQLLGEGTKKDSGWIWDDKVRAYQVPEDQFDAKMPKAKTPEYTALATEFQSTMGHKGSAAELQRFNSAKQVFSPVPTVGSAQYKKLAAAFENAAGRPPSPTELGRFYNRFQYQQTLGQ